MAWLGVTDCGGGWFSPGASAGGVVHPGTLLPRGTLMLEARLAPGNRPQTLLAFERAHPWPGRFSLQALPGGSVVMVEAQGNDPRSTVLPCPYEDRTDIVRLSYSWDGPARYGRLTIERTHPGHTHSVTLPAARPMAVDDLQAIMCHPGRREMDTEVIFAAISDRVEPVGPMPGLTAQTPVMTHLGEKPVSRIRRGDVVLTDTGEGVPVLQVVRRTVPARGSFRPIRLRAGYFGLRRDIVVAPCQKLVMRGSQVEYMFGSEAVLVPARHLVNNVAARWANGPETVCYYQLLLPGHETVTAAGCALASLFIGRIRRKPDDLAASVLAGFERARLPEHAQPAWPVLKPFEAVTLAAERAA
ncbi:Hint domain-containing protein [Roseovarius amoyensis]|uniref:Hint domain-containing protein n=1 Tax=Roseovarius amoyensis TaxID=2211448 RepID=UPI0019550182|nr:Hint domain-containing protein [Roseovarius amoyensis]